MKRIPYFLTLCCVALTNTSSSIILSVFNNIPEVMEEMMNNSFHLHYGGYLDTFWLSTVWSVSSVLIDIGRFASIFLLVPLLEKKGTKFMTVNIRLYLTTLACLLQMAAYFLPSVEAFILVWLVMGSFIMLTRQAAVYYLTELAPEYKAYVIGFLSVSDVLGGVLTMNLSRPAAFGSSSTWIYLPVCAFLMTAIPSIYLCSLPDLKKESEKKRSRTLTYGSIILEPESVKESPKALLLQDPYDDEPITCRRIWKEKSLRQTMILLVSFQSIMDVSPVAIEILFFTRLHQLLGFSVDMVMTIGTVQRIVFLPFTLLIVVVMKKFGMRALVVGCLGILYLKVVIALIGLESVQILGVSWISYSSGILGDIVSGLSKSFGNPALVPLILCELTPSKGVAAMTQIITITSLISEAIFNGVIPYALSYFPPLLYFFFLVFWPPLFYYIYRRFPYVEVKH